MPMFGVKKKKRLCVKPAPTKCSVRVTHHANHNHTPAHSNKPIPDNNTFQAESRCCLM
ncbi:hypothetical protein EYF80_064107 [Liparis tanakae]|uniref:Uncharacterized protein n=1 Tax=Liparis tanakae TaxID=230148 RepID=A0A4Z2EAH9_9TELE|nr:hypothetical protein EYF80_064107 [Liparis tanakae]